MSKKIIAVIGDNENDKAAAVNILKKIGYVEKSFIKPLKKFARCMSFTKDEVYGTNEQKNTDNLVLNISSVDFIRKFEVELHKDNMKITGKSILTSIMEHNIERNKLIVVTDCKFVEDAKMINEYGGYIIRIISKIGNNKESVNEKNNVLKTFVAELEDISLPIDVHKKISNLKEVDGLISLNELESLYSNLKTMELSDDTLIKINNLVKKYKPILVDELADYPVDCTITNLSTVQELEQSILVYCGAVCSNNSNELSNNYIPDNLIGNTISEELCVGILIFILGIIVACLLGISYDKDYGF
jgi:hypothetical protein